jgi:hypothetical protein
MAIYTYKHAYIHTYIYIYIATEKKSPPTSMEVKKSPPPTPAETCTRLSSCISTSRNLKFDHDDDKKKDDDRKKLAGKINCNYYALFF